MQFLINKDEDLTTSKVKKIIENFQSELSKLRTNENYYSGKHNILQKHYSDESKPCNKVVINYCHSIVHNYLGYLTGKPIKYSGDNFDKVLDILKYNDYADEDTELLRQALLYGVTYEINYIDEEGQQRFRVLDAKECIPIYYNNLNNDLAYVIRFYKEDFIDTDNDNYIVEVYGNLTTQYYKSDSSFSSFNLLDEQPNYYNQVPITVFELNKEGTCIFEQVKSLNDAYDNLFSGSIDDFESFADAYLVLKGAIADKDDIDDMKKNRVLILDTDSDASYLTKSITDTALQDILTTANDHIHTISNSPDFNDEKFMAQSGIAMKYKLVGFENVAASIESQMRKALQKRIELICSIISLTDETTWRDCEITFTRNLPISLEPNDPNELLAYRNLVSDETLLEQVPFVSDVDAEMKRVSEQQEKQAELYSFNNDNEEDEE